MINKHLEQVAETTKVYNSEYVENLEQQIKTYESIENNRLSIEIHSKENEILKRELDQMKTKARIIRLDYEQEVNNSKTLRST